MEIVIHNSFGRIWVSDKVKDLYYLKSGGSRLYIETIKRNDPLLIEVLRETGEANTEEFELDIITIPDDVKWEIHEYEGIECIL